jgi:pilus assembly protein CpaE
MAMSNQFPDPFGSPEPVGGAGVELAPPGGGGPGSFAAEPSYLTNGGGGDPMGSPSAATPDLRNLPLATVDADESVRTQLAMQLGQHAVPFPSIEALAARLTGQPLVVVLGPSMATPDQLAVVERLTRPRPEVGAVLIAQQLTTELLQQALRAGVRDVLPLQDLSQLATTVKRVGDMLSTTGTGAAPAGTDPAGLTGMPEPGGHGQVITVFSTKGGAGKSMIACNVAVRLAKRSSGPVALVDADLQFGDVAVMLKLAPQHTIVDAVGSLDRMDANLLQSLLVVHEPSGLQVLPAPLEPAFADQIRGEEMVRVIEVLRTFCTHVVIDTPAYFNDVVLGLIEISDDVLLVAGMDIPNIKNVKIGLQTLRLLNTPMSKLRLVLNRANSKVKLDVSEVEKTLQVKADALIPSDVVVPQSVNKGTPVVLAAPKAAVTRAIEQLADTFLTETAER